MRLVRLLKRLNNKDSAALPYCSISKVNISGIACDSRQVQKGAIFVAVDGAVHKGGSFIDEALKRGAACVVSESPPGRALRNRGVPFIRYSDTRYALALLADEFFGHPSKELKAAAVTGTNGKTTVTYLIKCICEEAGSPTGVIGTVGYSFKGKEFPAANTTPGPIELQSLLRQMADSGCAYCIMEASSHGISQQRVRAIDFIAAIFTNLTQDHLDYHRNMENYFAAKSELFRNLSKDAYAILNADDPAALRLKSLGAGRPISYGIHSDAQVKAERVAVGLSGSEFILNAMGKRIRIKSPLIGSHNISNILAASAFALTQNIELTQIKKALGGFAGVRGRLQRVKARERNVFIDYAHTPDALENVLRTLRALSRNNKLTVVFGCGGERDSLKRPLMGEVARRYADTVIITSDNPRSEGPDKIAKDIARGIKNKPYKIILDRKEAIAFSLAKSGKGDIVLIAGKGHERYQIFKDKKTEFDDYQVAGEYLKGRG
jgi:UDP-N-acetylmuramoyl-L-alanyl-D-glutamate--2,6-diaminopimelate ligase